MEIESVPYPERESKGRRGGLSRRFHRFLLLHLDDGDGRQRAAVRQQTPEGSRKGRDGTGNGGGGGKGEWSSLGRFGGDGGGQEDERGSHGGTVRAGEGGRSWLGGFERAYRGSWALGEMWPNRKFWVGGGSATVSREETPGVVVVRRPMDRENRDMGGVFFFSDRGRAVDGDDGGTDHEGGDKEGSNGD